MTQPIQNHDATPVAQLRTDQAQTPQSLRVGAVGSREHGCGDVSRDDAEEKADERLAPAESQDPLDGVGVDDFPKEIPNLLDRRGGGHVLGGDLEELRPTLRRSSGIEASQNVEASQNTIPDDDATTVDRSRKPLSS